MKKRKRKRKYKRHGIPAILGLALIVIGIFWWVYGAAMLLRYILGGLMFATFTVFLIAIIKKYFGRKVIKLW